MEELKEFKKEDIPDYLNELRETDPKFLLQMAGSGYTFPLTSDQIEKDIKNSNHLLFKFVKNPESLILGYCQLTKINWKSQSASIGRVLINKNHLKQGYCFKMIYQLIHHCKNELNFNKLYLRVFDFNKPAISCYEKLGFIEVKREVTYYQQIYESWNSITMEKEIH